MLEQQEKVYECTKQSKIGALFASPATLVHGTVGIEGTKKDEEVLVLREQLHSEHAGQEYKELEASAF